MDGPDSWMSIAKVDGLVSEYSSFYPHGLVVFLLNQGIAKATFRHEVVLYHLVEHLELLHFGPTEHENDAMA